MSSSRRVSRIGVLDHTVVPDGFLGRDDRRPALFAADGDDDVAVVVGEKVGLLHPAPGNYHDLGDADGQLGALRVARAVSAA